MKKFFLVGALLFTATYRSEAQSIKPKDKDQPLQEVFQTELVYPQEKGEFQLTFGSRFSRGADQRSNDIPTRLEYGITEKWQVEVEWNANSRFRPAPLAETENGVGDVGISTKYSFLNIRGSNFHSAVSFEAEFPTGDIDKGLTEGFIEYRPSVSFARDFPGLNRLQIFSETGVALKQRVKRSKEIEDDESDAHEIFVNGGFFLPFKQASFVGEINWNTNQWNKSGITSEVYLTPGFIYKLPGKWEVGFGVPIGVSRDADKYRTILQAVFEF